MKVVIVSDIHLGSWGSEKDKFLDFIKDLEADHLILNGDIYDLYLGDPSFNIFDNIRENQKIVKITYVIGNHDSNISDFFPSENFVKEVSLDDNIVVSHGAEFDYLLKEDFAKSGFWVIVKYWIEKIFKKNFKLWLNKTFIGNIITKKLLECQEKAIAFYPNKRVIIGHTHIPMCSHPKYNSGGFVDGLSYYIVINYLNGVGTITQGKVV